MAVVLNRLVLSSRLVGGNAGFLEGSSLSCRVDSRSSVSSGTSSQPSPARHNLQHDHLGAVIPIENEKSRRSRRAESDFRSRVTRFRRDELVVSTANPATEEIVETDDGFAQSEEYPPLRTPQNLEGRFAERTRHPFSHLEVGNRWREMQGESKWNGLLDPMDPVLRGEVIRYGEFTQATYDAFDYDIHSRFCGSSKYSKNRLFHKLRLENRGYKVTDFLYATAGEGNPVANFFRFIDRKDAEDHELEDLWDAESNWMGYVAVTTDPEEIRRLGRRDIMVVWRGTVTRLEWLENLRDYLAPTGMDPRRTGQCGAVDLKVEAGFLQVYRSANQDSPYTKKSARKQVLEAVARLVRKYSDEELSITVTGHSLGSALAQLCAYDLAESGINQPNDLPDSIHSEWEELEVGRNPNKVVELTESPEVKTVPITVFSYGGPRVGNDAFGDRMEALGVRVLRVVNKNDKVPKVPGLMINEKLNFLETKLEPFWRWLDSLPWTYSHVGVPLYIDNLDSPFLKRTRDPNSAHNLEGYLHVLGGYHGAGKPFELAIMRDIALVNKACDLLHRRHCIPGYWWQEENKGLVRTEEGCWIPRSREPEDIPEYNADEAESSLLPDSLAFIE